MNLIDIKLDREYNLRVVANDHGTPSLSSVAVVNVRITDPPCVTPDPDQDQWHISLPEDIDVPRVLLNLTHRGSRLTLLQDTSVDASGFELDPDVSVIWLKKPLDREQSPVIALTLTEQKQPQRCFPRNAFITPSFFHLQIHKNYQRCLQTCIKAKPVCNSRKESLKISQ